MAGGGSLRADDLSVTGNLNVTGTGVIQGTSLQLGIASGTPTSPGLIFTYADSTNQIGFSAPKAATTWIWQYNNSGTYAPQMGLDATNKLTIYDRASTPNAAIVLNPTGTSSFAQSLTVNGTNNLLPNQTLTGASSILTEGLADARYVQSANFAVTSLPEYSWQGAGNGLAVSLNGGVASAPFSTALTAGSVASGGYSLALGYASIASGQTTVAIGSGAQAIGGGSTAIASSSWARGVNSVSLGSWSTASGVSAVSIGANSTSSGAFSMTLGASGVANGTFAVAGGVGATAQGFGQFVVGAVNVAQGNAGTWVATDDLFIVGNGTATYNLGNGTLSPITPSNAFAVKKNGETSVFGSKLNFGLVSGVTPGAAGSTGARLIYADGTAGAVTFSASKSASTWAWQNNDTATAKPQMSLSGANVLTLYNSSGTAAIVLDPAHPPVTNGITQTIADGRYASSTVFTAGTGLDQYGSTTETIAIGGTVGGGGALAVGLNSYAGDNATAVGGGAYASTPNAVALGNDATAGGAAASAIGYAAWAQGDNSTASGYDAETFGMYSTASATNAEANGYSSTASGSDSYALGDYSTASAFAATAQGEYSVAAGPSTTAAGFAQFVVGQYNAQQGDPSSWNPTDDLFQVGNGTDPMNQSNAFTVKKNGDTTVAGQLVVAGRIRVNPQGNLAMGEYTADPSP